jgi:hypothetical protein
MNAAQFLILGVGVAASVVLFMVMRFPGMRRPQFREHPPFSWWASALSSAGLLAAFALLARLQP